MMPDIPAARGAVAPRPPGAAAAWVEALEGSGAIAGGVIAESMVSTIAATPDRPPARSADAADPAQAATEAKSRFTGGRPIGPQIESEAAAMEPGSASAHAHPDPSSPATRVPRWRFFAPLDSSPVPTPVLSSHFRPGTGPTLAAVTSSVAATAVALTASLSAPAHAQETGTGWVGVGGLSVATSAVATASGAETGSGVATAVPAPVDANIGARATQMLSAAVLATEAGSLTRSALQPDAIPRGLASAWLLDEGLPLSALATDMSLSGLTVHSWGEGPVERIALEGWAEFIAGSYVIRAERATAWIHRVREDGRRINVAAIYFEGIFDANRPSGVSADGRELLITIRTTGAVRLRSDRFRDAVPPFDDFMKRAESRLAGHLNAVAARRQGAAAEDVPAPASEVVRPQVIQIDPIDPALAPAEPGRPVPPGTIAPPPRPAPSATPEGQALRPGQRRIWPNELSDAAVAAGPNPLAPEAGGPRLEVPGDLAGAVRPPQATILFRFDELEYTFAEEGAVAGPESEAEAAEGAGTRPEEGAAILTGGIVLQYHELRPRPGERERRSLTLTADRAVVFTDPIEASQVATGQLDAESVRGAYLEGNVVATDGEYTMRGVRMFYDFQTNRAIVLDGVLSTYDAERRTPLYARASVIRQKAMNSWEADDVTLSTSEFFVPHIGIGATRMAIEDRPVRGGEGEQRLYADARNSTVELGGLPVFWWPRYVGPAEDIPIRELSVRNNDIDGWVFATTWDFYSLIGRTNPGRVDADLKLDFYSERGMGGGLDFDWEGPGSRGSFTNYFIDDTGTDKLSSGAEIERDDFRSIVDFAHFERLPNDWLLIAEFGHVSDAAFVDSFFEELAETGRPLESRVYLKQQRDNWAFDITASYDFDDVISVHDRLQTPGYEVERVPELGYYRYADRLFDDAVAYSSEWRYGRVRFSFPRFELEEIGQGQVGFGIDPNMSLADAAYADGYRENWVNRFHTRHELSMPMRWGDVNVVPFLTGHFNAYDDDFEEFDPQAEQMRWWAGGGVRLSTQLWKINNGIESRFFDLHRLRHIIEPSLTLWHGETNAQANDYPIYDPEIEGISAGSAVKLGLHNTWQTQRGGPGRWRSVDVFRLDGELVFTGGNTQSENEIPHWYDYRPEYSRLGDHARVDGAWLVSDTLAIGGHTIYDLNESAVARSSIGYQAQHGRNFVTFADLRYFDASDESLLGLGLGYELTPKYFFLGTTNWDLDENESRSVNAQLTRREPQLDITLGVQYDQTREETTVSFSLSPQGQPGRRFGGILNPTEAQREQR